MRNVLAVLVWAAFVVGVVGVVGLVVESRRPATSAEAEAGDDSPVVFGYDLDTRPRYVGLDLNCKVLCADGRVERGVLTECYKTVTVCGATHPAGLTLSMPCARTGDGATVCIEPAGP